MALAQVFFLFERYRERMSGIGWYHEELRGGAATGQARSLYIA